MNPLCASADRSPGSRAAQTNQTSAHANHARSTATATRTSHDIDTRTLMRSTCFHSESLHPGPRQHIGGIPAHARHERGARPRTTDPDTCLGTAPAFANDARGAECCGAEEV